MTEYIVHTVRDDIRFMIRYKDGKFKSLELVSGKMKQEQHEFMLKLAPQIEKAIPVLQKHYEGKITWERIVKDPKTLFRAFMDEYSEFYNNRFNLPPKITGIDGNAMKSIIKFVSQQSQTDDEALNTWIAILTHWDTLPDFYQNQADLRQINSNLNTILRFIVHGNESSKTRNKANDLSNDLRASFKNRTN